MDSSQYPALPVYAFFTCGLCLFVMALDGASATFRAKTKTTLNKEDSTTTSKGAELVDEERPEVARANRAWRNAFANTVPHLAIAWLFVLTGKSGKDLAIYMGVFAGARLIHAIVYLAGKQPWRTLMFVVGQLATAGLAYHVVAHFARA